MILEKVFDSLKLQDRQLTKKRFCSEYLGKCESYLYVMKHRNKEISNDALVRCYVGLKKTADTLYENGFVDSYNSNKRLADMVLENIENKVVEEL